MQKLLGWATILAFGTVANVALKLLGLGAVAGWNWLWVLWPLWLPTGLLLVMLLATVLILSIPIALAWLDKKLPMAERKEPTDG